jgi:hypothetical protein
MAHSSIFEVLKDQILLHFHSVVGKKAARPLWQVKQRWARSFDPARVKLLIFKILFSRSKKLFALENKFF